MSIYLRYEHFPIYIYVSLCNNSNQQSVVKNRAAKVEISDIIEKSCYVHVQSHPTWGERDRETTMLEINMINSQSTRTYHNT